MNHPGFELYSADWQTVRDACRDDLLEELRSGAFSSAHLHFPATFGAGDVLLIETAVARLASRSAVSIEIERDEVQGGLFVDRIDNDWVKSVTDLPAGSGEQLFAAWVAAYREQELRDPDWASQENRRLGSRLIDVCRNAIEQHHDLVMVWLL